MPNPEQNKQNHTTQDNYCCACEYDIAVFENLLSQIRQETIEKIKEFIVAEINIARTEGDKTSRLTSLFMRITELK